MGHTWEEAQAEEQEFWGTCQNTLGEELKQLTYARHMGIGTYHDGNSPYNFELVADSALDVGGGPVSMLLKCPHVKKKTVADPCKYPKWTVNRYTSAGVTVKPIAGEDIDSSEEYDLVLMYNVLQHTEDPDKIFANIHRSLKPKGKFMFFEWIDTPTNEAHPITLSESQFRKYIQNFDVWYVDVSYVEENTAVGKAIYGWVTK